MAPYSCPTCGRKSANCSRPCNLQSCFKDQINPYADYKAFKAKFSLWKIRKHIKNHMIKYGRDGRHSREIILRSIVWEASCWAKNPNGGPLLEFESLKAEIAELETTWRPPLPRSPPPPLPPLPTSPPPPPLPACFVPPHHQPTQLFAPFITPAPPEIVHNYNQYPPNFPPVGFHQSHRQDQAYPFLAIPADGRHPSAPVPPQPFIPPPHAAAYPFYW